MEHPQPLSHLSFSSYDPPQRKSGFLTWPCLPWYDNRLCDGYCSGPFPTIDLLTFFEDEEAVRKACTPPPGSKCPRQFRGLWWLRDHVLPECLVTIHDADWDLTTSPDSPNWTATKKIRRGWSRSTNCVGCAYHTYVACTDFETPFQAREDVIKIGAKVTGNTWIFKAPQSGCMDRGTGDVFRGEGEFLRLHFKERDDPTSDLVYAYRLQRLAHIEEGSGRVVLNTPVILELKKRATNPSPCLTHLPSCLVSSPPLGDHVGRYQFWEV